jgi:hypothetical protein
MVGLLSTEAGPVADRPAHEFRSGGRDMTRSQTFGSLMAATSAALLLGLAFDGTAQAATPGTAHTTPTAAHAATVLTDDNNGDDNNGDSPKDKCSHDNMPGSDIGHAGCEWMRKNVNPNWGYGN